MQKNNDSKKHKSGFNPNCTCCMTADSKCYCYKRWNDDTKCVVTQRFDIGKALSVDLMLILNFSDQDKEPIKPKSESFKIELSDTQRQMLSEIISKTESGCKNENEGIVRNALRELWDFVKQTAANLLAAYLAVKFWP